MTDTHTAEAERFFYDHGGYSYGPSETPEQGRRRSALTLAAAEWWFEMADGTFELEDEYDLGSATDEQIERIEAGETIYVCALARIGGEIVGALGGIEVSDLDDPYLRVVRAELASEARREIETEQAERADAAARDIETVSP